MSTQLRARERDIAEVVQSPSWRLTAPLRTAKRNLARARRLPGQARHRLESPHGGRVPSLARETGVAASGPSAAELRYFARSSRSSPRSSTPTPSGSGGRSTRFATRPIRTGSSASPTTARRTSAPSSTCARSADDPRDLGDVFAETGGGIAAATNRALAAAGGEFVAFLDHDDELDPDALLECVRRLDEKPDTDVVYTDEDKLDRHGRRSEPFFKPDWSPELFRGVMYVGHLLLVRRTLVERAGGLDSTFDGVQDYELMLRVSERTERIEHVPRILYHWRKLPGSIAASTEAKSGISELQASAVTAHLERCGIASVARPNPAFPHRAILEPKPRSRWPRVTVIVPTKDAPAHLERCLRSIFGRSTYPSFEVILVDNGTTDPEARRLFELHPVEVLSFDEPFNFSRVNNLGVAHASGEFVVFLNNDTEVRTPEWLEILVHLAERGGAGAVGPLLVYPNGTVQHAGVVLGLRGTADHIMRGLPATADGHAGSLSCAREVSAVTAACMALRRETFLEAGGFDEHFGTHYQDVDLCLRLRRAGLRNLFTPRAIVRHDESATRGADYDHLDRALLLDRWGETIARGDPYYSPRLSLSGADYRPKRAA